MRIQKLADNNFDTSKTVLLCCKGPSSIDAPEHAEGKYVAVTTSACNIFDRCDFLFANDVEFFETADIGHVDNIIVPLVMHLTEFHEGFGRPVAGIHEHLPTERHVFHHAIGDLCTGKNVYTYKLHTQDQIPKYKNMEISPAGDDFSFPLILSGYHTALYWLIKAGFRDFEIFGVSTCGSYNDNTVNKKVPVNPRPLLFYQQNYQLGIDILEQYGCSYTIHTNTS
jgi:hypothetical protein